MKIRITQGKDNLYRIQYRWFFWWRDAYMNQKYMSQCNNNYNDLDFAKKHLVNICKRIQEEASKKRRKVKTVYESTVQEEAFLELL